MPEAEFTIDTASGEFRLHVRGVAGPACEDLAKLVKDLAGAPGIETNTAEYCIKPRVRSRTEVRARLQGG